MPRNNSALRGSLIAAVGAGTPPRQVAQRLGVSLSTAKRSQNIDPQERLNATVSGYSKHCNDEMETAYRSWLETALPVLSGRPFRLQTKTTKDLFQQYEDYCSQQGLPSSARSKFYLRLHMERIHKSRQGVPCSDCALFARTESQGEACLTEKQRKRLPKARAHCRAVPIQRGQYLTDRANLQLGELLVVQDYTKHDKDIHSTTQQDHIVVLYWKEEREGTAVERYDMLHFIAPEGVKNDVRFSMHVWQLLQFNEQVMNAERLIVWSDNGPKHFKLSAYLFYMSFWAESNCKKVSMRFNTPYHGACVADSAAAHLKQATKRHIARTGDDMKQSMALVKVANGLKNHRAELIKLAVNSTHPIVKTWKQLTQYYHWEPWIGGRMMAWRTSLDYYDNKAPQLYVPDPDDTLPYFYEPNLNGVNATTPS